MSVVAICFTSVTMYGMWEARGHVGICGTLNETMCTTDSMCEWDTSSSECNYDYDLNMLITFGAMLSTLAWIALGVHNNCELTDTIVWVWKVSYALLFTGLAAFTLAMWLRYESKTAAVFLILFLSVGCGIVFASLIMSFKVFCNPSPQKGYSKLQTHDCVQLD